MTLRPLRRWFGYFKHSKANVFGTVDAYVRGRLRSILRSLINHAQGERRRRGGFQSASSKRHRLYRDPFAGALPLPCLASRGVRYRSPLAEPRGCVNAA